MVVDSCLGLLTASSHDVWLDGNTAMIVRWWLNLLMNLTDRREQWGGGRKSNKLGRHVGRGRKAKAVSTFGTLLGALALLGTLAESRQ